MKRYVGAGVLAMSAMGFPLTQLVIARWGRCGAAAVECVCAGLLVRDAVLIAHGAPRRLRRAPAVLLWCELAAASAAVIAGLPGVVRSESPLAVEVARRVAVAMLFGLHTYRFGIYLRPGQGRLAAG